MKLRGLIVAALVFFVLAGVLYWTEHRKPEKTSRAAADTPPAILKLDEASIARLEIKKKDAPAIVLSKAASGEWEITAPNALHADQSSVSSMLSALSSLDSQRLVDEKPRDLQQYGLAEPLIEVGITSKDKRSQKLLLGDDTPTSGAAFAKLAADPRVFTVASFSKSSLDKTVNDLRDKRLMTVSSDKVSRVELIRENQHLEFGRNKDDWQILKPRPLRADNQQVGDLINKLADARMELSGAGDKPAAAEFRKGSLVGLARLTDPSGTQQLEIRKTGDTWYAKSSVVEGVYKVGSDLAQSLDKGIDDFRNKKLFDFGLSEPDKVDFHDGSKAYFLKRTGQDWWSDGKKMDASGTRDLISRLRDLTASKFPETPFGKPAIEVSITSDDGKRSEKVQIAKAGGAYIARRENEPGQYEVEASAVDELQKAADRLKPAAATK